MEINQRFFQLDTEWCVIHIPERPSGFGVIIVGDYNHFVDENSSLWLQNTGRFQLIQRLLQEGYTVFYSNLYGRNWGSQRAVNLLARLYHIVMKTEILNNKVHFLAEGMGALVALQVHEQLDEKIRSIALLNPCIDLVGHFTHEKETKFFYKRLLRELSASYRIDRKDVEDKIETFAPTIDYSLDVPIKIWQTTIDTTYRATIHCRKFEEERIKMNKKTSLVYHLNEKKFGIGQSLCKFFKENEQIL
ncbi:hypothetical protein LCL95_08440 [Bacillus timonensis]|nr:hypothetical protein [Bacillus timonensis]